MSVQPSSPAATLLSEADHRALLDAVQRVARTELAALVARPEQPMAPEQLAHAMHLLGEMGLLPCGAEPGCSLWDDPADASLRRFSVEALGALAQVSPAVAYLAHQQALGMRLDRWAGARLAAPLGATPGQTLVALDGCWGVGRQALALTLAGQPLTPGQAEWLADVWAPPQGGRERLVFVSSATPSPALWWPQWTPAQGWVWCRAEPGTLASIEHEQAHGLDELRLLSWQAHGAALTCPDADAALLTELLTLHGLGLLAIAQGTAERAIARARDYAHMRRQGARLIIEHAAVQQLLAEAAQSAWLARTTLDALWAAPPGVSALHAVWRARARLQPQLVDAASRALQVFGGMGYMRDTGAEKDLRDVNTLRQLGGSPTELTLCCAALDGLLHPPAAQHPHEGALA